MNAELKVGGSRRRKMDDAVTQLASAYRQHGRALLIYLRRGFAGVDSPEDLLQETLLQVARRPQRLSDAVSPRAWLFSVARKVALTALRRRKVTKDLPADVPHETVQEDGRLERMRLSIASLPSQQRVALELRLRDGLTYEEIAAVLEIPIGTVRSRLHHAVRRLREELVGEEES